MTEYQKEDYKIEEYRNTLTVRVLTIPDLLATLTPGERVFIYYFHRACLPVNKVFSDQIHRYSNEIQELFEFLYKEISSEPDFSLKICMNRCVRDYLVFLWTNHSHYYQGRLVQNKCTPQSLGLKCLSKKTNLEGLIQQYGYNLPVEHLFPHIYDDNLEPSTKITGSIEQSGGNLYEKGFTNQLYNQIPQNLRGRINSYYYLDNQNCNTSASIPNFRPYGASIGFQNYRELSVSVFWLNKALDCAKTHLENFDRHFIKSLELLILYLEIGDEDIFREHTIEWLQSNSRIDYLFGFIENYEDPMSTIGLAGAEVTIKDPQFCGDQLNTVFLALEELLPYPSEYKRTLFMHPLSKPGENKPHPKHIKNNFSVNYKIFTAGRNGPRHSTVAYCLPNYDDIKNTHGSKQICYNYQRIQTILNPSLNIELSLPSSIRKNLEVNNLDPKGELYEDIRQIQVMLHETVGHSSGKLGCYFKDKHVYITDNNVKEFIKDYSAMEEMRADINAVYLGIVGYNQLQNVGLYRKWSERFREKYGEEEGEVEFKKRLLAGMLSSGLKRYAKQKEDFVEITGAHNISKITILNWVLAVSSAIDIIEEEKYLEGQYYRVLGIQVLDLASAMVAVRELCVKIQTIKSEGRGAEFKELIAFYTKNPISIKEGNRIRIIQILNQTTILNQATILNQTAIQNKETNTDVESKRCSMEIYPLYIPIKDSFSGEIIDMKPEWPKDIFEQHMTYRDLVLSTII